MYKVPQKNDKRRSSYHSLTIRASSFILCCDLRLKTRVIDWTAFLGSMRSCKKYGEQINHPCFHSNLACRITLALPYVQLFQQFRSRRQCSDECISTLTIALMAVLSGLLMGLTGMGFWGILTGAVFGLLGDLVMKSGSYQSAKKKRS